MKVDRKAEALWLGTLREGKGTLTTQSGILKDAPYTFKTRFESEPGTNPEELLAAAHAGCFTMALTGQLAGAGITPERLHTNATVTVEKLESGFQVTKSALELEATVPGVDAAQFESLAQAAKAGCPVSKLFNTEITLAIHLNNG